MALTDTPNFLSLQTTEKISFVSYLKTLPGSLKFQNKLEHIQGFEINFLLVQLLPHMTELMCSKHANYFIQKLLKRLDIKQRLNVFHSIEENFIQICKNKSGTHAIQGLISVIQTHKEEKILENLLKPFLFELFCNENSIHIIQKIILDFPESKRIYLNQFVIENIDELCLNEYGYQCLIKFILMTRTDDIRKSVAKEISSFAIFTKLVSNKFGANILIYAVTSFGIEYFENLFMDLREKNNLIFYSNLNEYSATFIIKFYQYINSRYHCFFVTHFYNLLNPKEEFVKNLLENANGEKVLFSFLKFSSNQVINYFIKNYQKISLSKEFSRKIFNLN